MATGSIYISIRCRCDGFLVVAELFLCILKVMEVTWKSQEKS